MIGVNDTKEFIKKLARREDLTEDKIREIIEESFRNSYCNSSNNSGSVLKFDFDSSLSIWRVYKIVEKVTDPIKEISKYDKVLSGKGATIEGENFLKPLDTKKFSFSLNDEIKKKLRNNLNNITWEKYYKIFKDMQKKGELVKGNIKDYYNDDYYKVELDSNVVGLWSKREWIGSREKQPKFGSLLYFLIKEIRRDLDNGESQIILTRWDDLFIEKLLENNIPEIRKGEIKIRHIIRIPGIMSKVLVESSRGLNDPSGACIGKGGERIKGVSKLMEPERIMIATWSDNKRELLVNLLSPVKVVSALEKENEWEVVVSSDKASLSLENGGRNLRKISEFLGKKIHISKLSELQKKKNVVIVWNGNIDIEGRRR